MFFQLVLHTLYAPILSYVQNYENIWNICQERVSF